MLKKQALILALKKEISEVLCEYDMGVCKVRFYAEEDHYLFIVYTLHEKFMLKVCQKDAFESTDLSLLFSWLDYLHQDLNEQVCQPVSNRHGKYFTEIRSEVLDADYYLVLYPWIQGRLLRQSLSKNNVKKWGQLLAKIHSCSRKFSLPEVFQIKAWDQVFYWEPCVLYAAKYDAFLPAGRKKVFKAMQKQVEQGLARLGNENSQPILIHGDLHPLNVKVHQQKLFAFDFDDFMSGYPVQDIAIALLYIRHLENFKALKKWFLRGYQEISEIHKDDVSQIELFFMGRLLWMSNACLSSDQPNEIEERFCRYEKEFKSFL